jgi:hypothetical protein
MTIAREEIFGPVLAVDVGMGGNRLSDRGAVALHQIEDALRNAGGMIW